MTIGEAVSKARVNKGFTQEQVSSETGLSRSYICDIENGRYHPSVKALTALALMLKIDLNFLIDNDGNTSGFCRVDKYCPPPLNKETG